MAETRYELTAAQAAFLESVRRPAPRDFSPYPPRARFPGALPAVSDQSVRGTCVASAVASLVAAYEGCRRRVSVQYLDEVTRLVEHAWIGRNMRLLLDGGRPEMDFAAAFPDAVSQVMLLVRANGVRSEAASSFANALAVKIRARVESDEGCRLKRCFEALEEYGACREELWPYSPVALNVGAAGNDAVGEFPPGTHEDARRHRIVSGLYVFRAPNNVEEIKGVLAGAQGRRPMPVCVGLDLFEGRTDGEFSLPDVDRTDGCVRAVQRPIGLHEVLIVAYEDDPKAPGGGYFMFQNSWGRSWGHAGSGRVSYAYVACFCREAGTILQDQDEFAPVPHATNDARASARRRATLKCAVGICLLATAVSISMAVWSLRKAEPRGRTFVVPADAEAESAVAERIVRYRYALCGICDSNEKARDMARILKGTHPEFVFDDLRVPDGSCYFEGEATIEGLEGRPPHAIQAVENFLGRKKLDNAVRKWSVRRIR